MNIIKMFMNNVIIPFLAVRICEDSDNRSSDKRGCTVLKKVCLCNLNSETLCEPISDFVSYRVSEVRIQHIENTHFFFLLEAVAA